MDRSIKKVIYFTNIFPAYRKELWKALLSLNGIEFSIYFSQKKFQGIEVSSVGSFFREAEIKKMHRLQNINLFGHLFWQKGVLGTLISKDYDSVIFLGDMKIISNWLGIFICKLRGKQISFWTHGIYGNERGIKKSLRLLYLSLADKIFLYEKRAKEILVRCNFSNEKLIVVYNSINLNAQSEVYKTKKIQIQKQKKHHNLIFFGRLTKVKKVDLAIKSVIELNKKNNKYRLKIVGDGPQKTYLRELVQSANANKFIIFENGKYTEVEIGRMFMGSDLLISPGNVGLNAVHAMTYGTPVLTHGNFNNQMPESQIIKEGYNGLFHEEDNINSIKEKIRQWFELYFEYWDRDKIRNEIIKYYDPIFQAQIIESSLELNFKKN